MKARSGSFRVLAGALLLAGLAADGHANIVATGGDITTNYFMNGTNFRAHIFTTVGVTNLTVTAGGPVEVLVVAGGGGGGGIMGGGGGAGGLIYTTAYELAVGEYDVVVGAGGLGGFAYNLAGQTGVRGSNSVFGVDLVAIGGGGGAGWSGHPSTSGGSGGGGNSVNAASTGTVGQGHAGAIGSNASGQRTGGGGGGAGADGGLGTAGAGGTGGVGVVVFGQYYAGGGGGGLEGTPLTADAGGPGGLGGGGAGSRGSTKAINGMPGTGGGGGGAGYNGASTGRIGGDGGSGIVVVRYLGDTDSPIVQNIGSTNVTATSADVSGTLITNGSSAATVYLYWSTSDGLTNAADWLSGGSVSNLGPQADSTTLTNTLTGLAPNTTYYWNYSASNLTNTVWGAMAGSPFFKTMGVPGVDNADGATAVRSYTATLNGTLTNGAVAAVFFLWGETAGTLTNIVDVGVRAEGAYSADIAGLTRDTPYYYRAYVSNAYGEAWAPVTNFLTTPYVLISSSTNLATSQTNLYGDLWVMVDGAGVVLTFTNSSVYGELPEYRFADLTVTNGASIVCASQGGIAPYTITNRGVAIAVSGDLVISSNASLHADGRGFFSDRGPGFRGSAGGSHGGVGGGNPPAAGVAVVIYGEVAGPLTLGSGGDCSYGAQSQGSGGGAIKITAGGVVTVNGRVSANGAVGTLNTWGGAGGSLWIAAARLAGNGSITANGAAGSGTPGGGGGRIDISQTTNDFVGAVQVNPYAGSGAMAGSLLLPRSEGSGLTLDNLVLNAGTNLWIGNSQTFSNVMVRPGATLTLCANPSNETYWFDSLCVTGVPGAVGSVACVANPFATNTASGGTIAAPHGTGVTLIVQTLFVDANATLHADNTGFVAGRGPSPGDMNNAGSHGGRGSRVSTTGTCYGVMFTPSSLGSGGGNLGYGGGAVQIQAGAVTNNGRISANGAASAWNHSAGAGGSVLIRCASLSGTGAIQARGGQSANNRSGGGGRVSVILTNPVADFTTYVGPVDAIGHSVGASAAGTVYLQAGAQGAGQGLLQVGNGTITTPTNVCTEFPPRLTVEELTGQATLLITNKAFVGLTGNVTVGDLFLRTNTATRLFLNGFTLTVKSRYHEDWGHTNWVVYDGGAIVWAPRPVGTVIQVR